MSFISDTVLQTSVAARLKTDWPTLLNAAPHWSYIVTDSNVQAYNQIVSVLTRRGFQLSTINSWDRGAEFNRRLGTYYAIRDGAVTEDVDRLLESLSKVEDELSGVDSRGQKIPGGGVSVLVNGVLVFPDNPGMSPVGQGDMTRTDTVFEGDNPTNPERSQFVSGAANYNGTPTNYPLE